MPNPQPNQDDQESHGACLCGAVTFSLRGAPLTTLLCHCNSCQISSGSSFGANLVFKKEQLTFLTGQASIKEYRNAQTDSGSAIVRAFCGICGSNVYVTSAERADSISIMSGCLDAGTKARFKPEREYYCRNRQAWLDVKDETVRMETMR